MSVIWVVVANQAAAEIYSMQRLRGTLSPVDKLLHDSGRARERDLGSDSPGRVHDRMGSARHSMEPDVGRHEEEVQKFARAVTHYLEVAHSNGNFTRLIVVAAPKFLGEIRKVMTKPLEEIIVEEISKDLVGQDTSKIEAQFS